TEVAALEALREAFARSESLVTLAPRLANLNAWIAKEMPPDRSRELQWAAEGLDHARRHCRPGSLTRAGREDRRRLEAAEARYATLSAEQGRREGWLTDHADTLAYRDELKAAVAERRHELGVRAAITQPDHVVAIIGSVPTHNPEAAERWINSSARIEAYREEWAVAPERLRERPRDACQERAWGVAVRTTELLARPVPGRGMEQSVDHGMELGW
ncbi:MAG TPA: hypothetical protein VK988_10210, partial [Acidimicrobiales bacterium]|nr:hypothetical protein [Acidimicrobiales bacterium]